MLCLNSATVLAPTIGPKWFAYVSNLMKWREFGTSLLRAVSMRLSMKQEQNGSANFVQYSGNSGSGSIHKIYERNIRVSSARLRSTTYLRSNASSSAEASEAISEPISMEVALIWPEYWWTWCSVKRFLNIIESRCLKREYASQNFAETTGGKSSLRCPVLCWRAAFFFVDGGNIN